MMEGSASLWMTILGWPKLRTNAASAVTATRSALPFFSVGIATQRPKASSTATNVVAHLSCSLTFGKQ
jgi:adenosylmethionine-8-amino-7-oxononanoate aminotransferase